MDPPPAALLFFVAGYKRVHQAWMMKDLPGTTRAKLSVEDPNGALGKGERKNREN